MHECNQAISGWKEYHMSENTISLYVYKGGQGEITEKKSRFIATVRPVESEDEAVSFINEMKKKYWDARHNCSAYVIGENNEIMHSSDDGEPSGTAGRPMLSVLTGQDVHNVAAVVTRYFGGVLLGTGGLVRAYQGAVSEALLHAEIRQQLLMQELMLTAEYTDVGKIQYLLSQAGFRTADTEYGAKVLFHVLVPAGEEDAAIKLLTEKTNGKVEITKGKLRNETCE